MKTKSQTLFVALALLALLVLNSQLSTAFSQSGQTPAGHNPALAPHTSAIPFDQIGAVARKQYSGDGLAVAACPDGAKLRCVFQRLNAKVTSQGLWLVSTKAGAKGKPFRVMARALGRSNVDVAQISKSAGLGDFPVTQSGAMQELARFGKVEVDGQLVRFIRPGLTEEYSVGIGGLQQDFVIEQRPPGKGLVRLELEVDGAKAEAMAGGARLVLDDGGRQMVYNRLKAVDAQGKQLGARLEVLSANRLAVVLHDTTAEYPLRIDPTFSDANWISFGGVPGVNGTVYAAALDGAGNLYVGGSFTLAGGAAATNIAEWNGSSWSPLGSGVGGEVNALAVLGTNLFVGGYFTNAGDVSANCIAQWNGSSWSALGSGMNSESGGATVNALAVSGTTLYVGGYFTNAGGVSANGIAQWNGSSWSVLGSGMNSGVSALAVSGITLYAGGSFTESGDGSQTFNHIAQWNGSNWAALGSGMAGSNNSYRYVDALAVSGGTLYAGGDFIKAGRVSANGIAQWNGIYWSALGLGVNSNYGYELVSALVVSGTNLYAGGNFTSAGGVSANNIAQWNGSSWSALGSGMNSGVNALAVSGGTLYAGGYFRLNGDGSRTLNSIAGWNGSSWSALGWGVDGDVNALALLGDNLIVGGSFTNAGGIIASNIAEWNGNSWSALGWGVDGDVNALAVLGNNLIAGGTFTNAGGIMVSNIAEWNGNSWSSMSSGVNSTVWSLAVLGSNLFVGGDFMNADGVQADHVAEWNGSSWSPLGSGVNNTVWSLAVSGTNLYAGGYFTTAGEAQANYIAQWNGSSWSALGSGVGFPGSVNALAVSGTTLYVGGHFTSAGGASANNTAQWNGSSWSPLGSGVNNTVWSLAVSGTNLYAAGYFTVAGGVSANCIAEWNGSSWSPLGAGLSGGDQSGPGVYTLAMSGKSLFVGGDFSTAGTNVSTYLAEAEIAPPTITSISTSAGAPTTLNVAGIPGTNRLWMTTNLTLPYSQWQVIATNVAGADGLFQFVDSNTADFNAKFYRLSAP